MTTTTPTLDRRSQLAGDPDHDDASVASKLAPAEVPPGFALTPPAANLTMTVTKRSGRREPVDLNKIVRAVTRNCEGLFAVDPMRVATRTISGLYDGASTRELDELSIRTAALLTAEEPEYGRLAARLLAGVIEKEVATLEIHAFSQSVQRGHELGLINDRLLSFVQANARKLNDAIDHTLNQRFDYFGLRTLYDRYLLRHPTARTVIETPQQFFLRIACALSEDVGEALALYRRMAQLDYIPSSPTLFNSGTTHEQLSSCFLLDSPEDSLEGIYRRYMDVAKLSKFSGGIGLSYTRVRSRGSLIRSTNGLSNGIVPWLKTLDASVAAVNQGGKRKGAACVYLEPWHADVEEFLELRDNTGDEARRTHNLNLANWIPDEFMRRVEADAEWSLFDPARVPQLTDLWGEAFERAYRAAEAAGLAVKQVKARDLYARMMRTLAQTGNGWMNFKDKSNRACNQTLRDGNVVHLSNLCTEILEVTSQEETAVCNLGSINLSHHVELFEEGPVHGEAGRFDFDKLAETVRLAVRQLDRVIDLNYYPIETARRANLKWRPVGLGVMGLQDVFFKLRLPFDSEPARNLSKMIAEAIYFHALSASSELAMERGRHPGFEDTRAAQGELQFDAGVSHRKTTIAGTACVPGSASMGCAIHCSSRSRRRRPSRPSPAATSASNRRCRTCSSARRCRATSWWSTVTLSRSSRHSACGRRNCATASRWRKDRSTASRRFPNRCARFTAPHGNCRCVRSSTWPPTAAPSSTRASRSTCSSKARTSASCRRCTCTRGRRA